jgi:hypothetical protein
MKGTSAPAFSRPGRAVEDAAGLRLALLLRACRTKQPDRWRAWERGKAVEFGLWRANLPRAGGPPVMVATHVTLSGRHGWARLMWAAPDGAEGESLVKVAGLALPCGAWRWLWRCPVAGHRCAALYLPPGGSMFASRVAQRLHYACQDETPSQRAARKARKLRRRLGETRPALGGSLPCPPVRMSARVYLRTVAAIRAAEARALAGIGP